MTTPQNAAAGAKTGGGDVGTRELPAMLSVVGPTEKGGRPTMRFVLAEGVSVTTTPGNGRNSEVVVTETAPPPEKHEGAV
jgi:hypothetical protein